MPCDTLAPYPWPCCLAEGYRNGDEHRANGPMWLVMATLLFLPCMSMTADPMHIHFPNVSKEMRASC